MASLSYWSISHGVRSQCIDQSQSRHCVALRSHEISCVRNDPRPTAKKMHRSSIYYSHNRLYCHVMLLVVLAGSKPTRDERKLMYSARWTFYRLLNFYTIKSVGSILGYTWSLYGICIHIDLWFDGTHWYEARSCYGRWNKVIRRANL